MALDTTTRINLEFECRLCGHEFDANKTAFFTSTDRKDGVEVKQVKAKCSSCSKWAYYPYERLESTRVTTGKAQQPKWRSGKLDRMRMDSTPSDFAEVINESNSKLAEKGYDMSEEE